MTYQYIQQKYINFIKQTLISKNLDNDDNSWESSGKLNDFVVSRENIAIVDSEDLEMNLDDLMIIVRIKEYIDENELAEILSERIAKVHKAINVLWIVKDLSSKLLLQNSVIKSVTQRIKKDKKKARQIRHASTIYICKLSIEDEIKIKNIKRHELLLVPPLDTEINIQGTPVANKVDNFKGYVFTAKLYDLVTVYNTVGDDIFKRNLRFGLGEQMGVNKAIKETLEKAPQYFWFRNNGITMVLEEPDKILDRTSEILLKPSKDENIRFSVINGAQTLTSAAEYYYKLESEIDKLKSRNDEKSIVQKKDFEKELTNAKEAQVLLRIIQLTGNDVSNEAQKVSVALNRQKPIKNEDIAFTLPFVTKLNKFLEDNNIGYTICKRGEKAYSNTECSLVDFARARKAISGHPGEARSQATGTLLKITPNEKFADVDVFVTKWENVTEELAQKTYDEHYKPIPFSIELAELYDSKNVELQYDDNSKQTILKNGKWYFVAFFIFALNGDHHNYSNFNFKIEDTIRNNFKLFIDDFVEFCYEIFSKDPQNTKHINSNTFKRSQEYSLLLNENYKNSNFYLHLTEFFDVGNDEDSDDSMKSDKEVILV